MHKISIIYVNYYCIVDILKSIDTINTNHEIEIVIVSNSPVDQYYQDLINKRGLKLKLLNDNYGFGSACNVGARVAEGEFLLFLNPDITFLNDAIDKLLRPFKDERIAAVGPRHVTEKKVCEPSVKTDYSYFVLIRWPFPFLKYLFSSKKFWPIYCPSKSEVVDVINGSAILIKKNIFDHIGGFDTNFFMYWEENDLCLRIRQQGYYIYYEKEAEVLHKGQLTTSNNKLKYEVIKHRSQKYFIAKHRPELLTINRVIGFLVYLIRIPIAKVFQNDYKVSQYKTLTNWYLKEYQ